MDFLFKCYEDTFFKAQYDIADLSVDIYYYSNEIRSCYTQSLQHIEQISEKNRNLVFMLSPVKCCLIRIA